MMQRPILATVVVAATLGLTGCAIRGSAGAPLPPAATRSEWVTPPTTSFADSAEAGDIVGTSDQGAGRGKENQEGEEAAHRILPLPVLFYTPETRWAGGIAALYAYRGSEEGRPATASTNLIYTQNRQVTAELGVDGYTHGEALHFSGELSYLDFPDVFHGIGNGGHGDAESFTTRGIGIALAAEGRVRPGLYAGADYEVARDKLYDVDVDGLLASGQVTGSSGGVISGLGIRLILDDRDNIFYPTSGGYAALSARRFGGWLGGDYRFSRIALDLRRYFKVNSRHVLALQGYAVTMGGDPPFQRLASLGGQDLLRGYFGGQFRDRHMVAAQAEYRLPVWWRFDFVGFAGVGQVGKQWSEFRPSGLHPAGGFGIRILLDDREQTHLRIDFGYGADDASGVYITLGEAF